MKRLAILTTFCFSIFFVGTIHAQEVPRFAFSASAGFTNPVGTTGTNLDVGWNVGVGAGVNYNQWFGVMIDAGYNQLGINSATLGSIGFSGGNTNVFSATLDPIVHLTPRSHFDLYVIGGGGYYRREIEFTAPTSLGFTGYNPFFGFYLASIPTNTVLSSYSVNKPGADIGAGIALGTKWHGKFFAEARYNRIFINGSTRMDYIPATFGFRW